MMTCDLDVSLKVIGCTMQDLTRGCQPARRHLLPLLSPSDAQNSCSRCVPLPPSVSHRPAASPCASDIMQIMQIMQTPPNPQDGLSQSLCRR